MKKLLSMALLFLASHVLSQPIVHSWILGGSGNIGFSLRNDDSDAATFSLTAKPTIGYAISNKWSIHGGIGVVYNYINFINLQDKKRYIYNKMYMQIQMSGRNYYMLSERFGFYLEPQVILNIKVADKQNIDGERKNQLKYQKQYAFSLGAEPGFLFFPRDNISIDFSVGGMGYSLEVEKWPSNTKLKHSFSSFINPVSINVGVKKYFYNHKSKEDRINSSL